MRILFVENHHVFAATVVSQFLFEHVVEVVSSVAGAVRALQGATYDVVLLDYDLDNEKGADLLQHLRTEQRDIPVIAVSARAEGNEALVRAGAAAVCAKGDFAGIGAVLERVRSHAV